MTHGDPLVFCSGVRSSLKREYILALPSTVGPVNALPTAVGDGDNKRFKKSDSGDGTPEAAVLPPLRIEEEGWVKDAGMVVDGHEGSESDTSDVINDATPPYTPMEDAEPDDKMLVTINPFAESKGESVVPEKPIMGIRSSPLKVSDENSKLVEAFQNAPNSAITTISTSGLPLPIESDSKIFLHNKRLKKSNSSDSIVVDDGSEESMMGINDHDGPNTVKPTRRITRAATRIFTRKKQLLAEAAPEASCGSILSEDETRDALCAQRMPLMADSKNKMELKMSKKISGTKLPSNMRKLLATGLLEGLAVKYITCMEKQVELKGVVKGTSILCYCASCKGSKAISAYKFVQHAGSFNKNPLDFIYLENGKTIHDILEACKLAPLDMLEASIQNAICPVPSKEPYFCQNCKEPFHNSHMGKFALCSCLGSNQPQTTPRPSDRNDSSARLSGVSDCSGSTSKDICSRKKVTFGKLTKKDVGLHKLVFMGDILPEGTEVGYYVRGEMMLQGYIKDSGIYCQCCKTVLTPSQFEAHAGHAKRRKPYNHIYTSNGVSLHELSVSLSKDRKLSASENDDLCSICADGGDLLLCDLCPRAFHKDCLGLSSIPMGDWHCRYCQNLHQRDKCVEYNNNAIAAGRVAGVDPIMQIFKRCIRTVETPETNVGGCVFCRRHDFSKSRFGPRTVLLCDQCEKEYHVGCLKDHNMGDLKEIPKGEWFCRTDCSGIHAALQELLVLGAVPVLGLDSDTIKRKHMEKGVKKDAITDVRWRLLSGRTTSSDSKLLLSRVVSIFHESFDPIVDSVTGRDLIPPMVYGRSTGGQDFGGMYCALLTVNSSVVSAGVLRVLGCEVAELPLVATKREIQGQGYFQTLFACIERLLVSLNVKHFVLPAAAEAESIWTKKFGFTRITDDQLQEYTRGAHLMSFHGTSMLHKPVPISQSPSSGCEGS